MTTKFAAINKEHVLGTGSDEASARKDARENLTVKYGPNETVDRVAQQCSIVIITDEQYTTILRGITWTRSIGIDG